MRAQTRSKESDRPAGRQRRAERAAEARPNRAQLRAMQVRAAESRLPDEQTASVAVADAAGGTVVSLPRRVAAATKRGIARPIVLSREQEFRFIRSDLRRLVITAGSLFVLMIALLFFVD